MRIYVLSVEGGIICVSEDLCIVRNSFCSGNLSSQINYLKLEIW